MGIKLSEKMHLKNNYIGEISSLQLGLQDEDGNALAVYKDGYRHLSVEIRQALSQEIGLQRKIEILKESDFNVVKYFNRENLQNYKVENIQSIDQIPGIMPTNGLQNCVVVNEGNVYVHPKIKSEHSVIGINHSSLSFGNNVDFAGSLVNRDGRWVLNNTTGHYGTRPSKISACLKAFAENNISIANLDLEHWILTDSSHSDDDSSYQIETVPAVTLLNRMASLRVKVANTRCYTGLGHQFGI